MSTPATEMMPFVGFHRITIQLRTSSPTRRSVHTGHTATYKWLAKAIYLRAAFYRPPGNPVLVGSDTFGRYQSGIPTHRYGAEAPLPAYARPTFKWDAISNFSIGYVLTYSQAR